MSFQLIFTSAARGLTLGRSGFSTVARHRELSESLVTLLERCSAYERPEGMEGSPPVIHAYRIIRLGHSSFHVLTRIQDAGVDYTQRGNHLAQHLIFTPAELVEVPSPADVFLNWSGWLDRWDEAARYLGPEEQPSLASIASSIQLPAKNWERRSGDSVHAAVLAQPALRKGAILTSHALPPSETLHLFGESLLLLDPDEAGVPGSWSVPFTTHLQSHEQEEDFFWRGEESDSPQSIVSRQAFPVFSFDEPSWPVVKQSTLAKRAREGGVAARGLKATARVPDLSLREKEPLAEVVSRPVKKSPIPSPSIPTKAAPGKLWIFAGVGLLVLGLIVAALCFPLRSSPASAFSLSSQIALLQLPPKREALRQFLREHPLPTGNAEDDSTLEKATLWLQASDWLDQLQFLRRQEQAEPLQETLSKVRTLPHLAMLQQSLPQLGYEMDEAQGWLNRRSAAATPEKTSNPPPSALPTPEPGPSQLSPESFSLSKFFGEHPVLLTGSSELKTLPLPKIPAAAEWMLRVEKNEGAFVRILPLTHLPLEGEGIIARPQPLRNRSDRPRFYQGVHLLFECRELDETDGSRAFELEVAKDFESASPGGPLGRVLQFEDASGPLFSIFILRQGLSEPLLRLPRSMIVLDPILRSPALRPELFRDTTISLAGSGLARLGSPAAEKTAVGLPLTDAASWAKLTASPAEANLPALALRLFFPETEEGGGQVLFILFEGEASP